MCPPFSIPNSSKFVSDIMDYTDLLPLCCLTLVTYFLGQIVMTIQQGNQRAKLAAQQRKEYFARLTQEANQTDEETRANINRLRDDNERIIRELREIGVDPGEDGDDDIDEEAFIEIVTLLKHERDDLDKKIGKCSKDLGYGLTIEDRWQQDLDENISRLQEDNEKLKKQLSSQDKPTFSDKLDEELMEYIEANERELNSTDLRELYESLLEIDPEELNRVRSGASDYEAELDELDVELDRRRVKAEKRLKQTKARYQDELNTFNETRLDYLFKIAGAREELDALKEKNDISEMIVRNLKEELALRQAEGPKLGRDL